LFKERIDKFKKNFPNHKRLTNLYEKIQKGEIEVDSLNYPQLKINSSKNFDQLSVKEQRIFFNRLNNYNTFLKNKGDKFTITELNNFLSKEISGFIPRQRFRNLSPENSAGSRFDVLLNSIVRKNMPEGKQYQLFLTKPTNAQLEKLKTAWNQRGTQGLFKTTVDRVVKLSENDSFMNILRKEKRLPSLEEIQLVLGDATSTEAGNAVLRLLQKIDGTSFVLPKGQENIFKNIRVNKKLAQDLLNSASGEGRRFSFYRDASYKAFSKNVDSSLNRAPGQTHINLKRKARAFLDDPSLEIHEPAGISTAGRFNLSSFANFVVPEVKVLNEGVIARSQSELTRILSKFKNGERSLDKTIKKYDDYIKSTYPELQNKVVTIIKPTKKAIEDWYGKENVKRYLKEYGMDLVGEAKEAGFAFGVPKNAIPLEEFININNKGNAEGGPPINREDFVTPGTVGDDEKERKEDRDRARDTGLSFGFGNIREIQQDIKDLYDDKLSDTIEPIRETTKIKVEDVLKDTRTVLNKGDRPIEVRPITEGYKLITESPIVRSIVAAPATGKIKALETVESIYNSLRKGTENDIQMEEYFPAVYGLRQFLTESVGETPDDQTYISFIDEVNRAQETGFTRLGYNIVDLASLAPDWAFGTDATGRIKKSYDKMIEEGRITEPETFLGEVGAIGVEFGVPGGAVFKGVNTLRRMIKATTGVNLFAVPTYSMGALVAPVTGSAILGAKISNVAKRVGTTAAVFGGTDFIAGGPYNTVSEVFKDDPLLFDNSLGYDYENTEGLSGKELSVANFKNRLRFGADGAIIGGLFPLVGPPIMGFNKIWCS
jgi:hypothetical protein